MMMTPCAPFPTIWQSTKASGKWVATAAASPPPSPFLLLSLSLSLEKLKAGSQRVMPTITWQLMKAMVMIMIRIMIIRQLLLLLQLRCWWWWWCQLKIFSAVILCQGFSENFPRGCAAAAQLWKTLIWKLLVNCCPGRGGNSVSDSDSNSKLRAQKIIRKDSQVEVPLWPRADSQPSCLHWLLVTLPPLLAQLN